jgi:glycosyltransferase involved in cell wall biosynthesis
MKIAILSTFKLEYNGGGEKWIRDISHALVHRGHHVDIFSPEDPSILNFNGGKWVNEISYKSNIYKIAKKLGIYNLLYFLLRPPKTDDYAVTYSTSFFSLFPLLRSNTGSRLILGTHDFYISESKVSIDSFRILWIWFLKIFLSINKNRKVRFHAINPFIAEKLQSITNDVKVIYSFPINYTNGQLNMSNNFRILFVGRLEKRKGADLLIQYAQTINGSSGIELNIAGKVTNRYAKVIRSAKFDNNVKFHGYLSEQDLLNLFQTSDLLIFFSRREAFSLTVLEALYNGLPIVTTYRPLKHLLDEKTLKISKYSISDLVLQVNSYRDMFINNKEEFLKMKNEILNRNRSKYNREMLIEETVKFIEEDFE